MGGDGDIGWMIGCVWVWGYRMDDCVWGMGI